jgi:hypothetical protein
VSTDHVRGHRLATAFILVGGLACLAVGVVLVLDPAERDAGAQVRFDDLRVGDCLQELELGGQARAVRRTPCDRPHVAEVFASFDVPSADAEDTGFPGAQRVGRLADEECEERLAEREDPLELDRYAITTVTPTAESWQDGDRVVHCLLVTEDGTPVTGPLLEGRDG